MLHLMLLMSLLFFIVVLEGADMWSALQSKLKSEVAHK